MLQGVLYAIMPATFSDGFGWRDVAGAGVSSDTVPGGAGFWAQVAAFACGAALALLLQRPERARVEWWSP